MLKVLVRLGLHDHYGTVFVPTWTVAYASGLHFSAGEVVRAYRWSIDSFKHKTLSGGRRKCHLPDGSERDPFLVSPFFHCISACFNPNL